jgi:capsular exopolysaccharide synthesis family protein
MAQRYLPKHPEMVRLQAQRDLLDRELAAQIAKIVRGIEAEYAVAADREKALTAELDAAKREKQALDKKEIEYRVLEREVETNRGLYDVLQKRMKETQVTENLRANNIRLIDRAEPPLAPVRPRTRVNLILGLILGLVGGAGLAFFFEFIDNTVKTQEDVEGLLRLPFLGIIPSFRGDVGERIATDLFAHEHPKSSVTESCRVIRTNLLFAAPDKTLRRLLVTSAGPQEGKSTTVTNLGIVLAQGGKRVLILDSDLRRPRLHKVFDVPAGRPGLTTLIMGEATLDEVIFATAVPGLSVIPCGPIPPTPSELLGSRHMEDLLPRLDERFDWVLFDSPPVIAVTDAVVLSRLADGVVLVVKAGKTTRDLVVRAKRQLDDVGAPILGTVLNDFNVLGDGYRYYYYYQAAREDAGGKRETRRRRGRPSAGEIPDA